MSYLDHLKSLKKKRSLTNAEVAELSGVPLSTVNRIFSGQTPNPQFDSVASIVIALDGSLDEFVGLRSEADPPPPSSVEQTLSSYAELLNDKDQRILEKKLEIKNLRRERNVIFFILVAFVLAVVILLFFDFINGHFGYIRY